MKTGRWERSTFFRLSVGEKRIVKRVLFFMYLGILALLFVSVTATSEAQGDVYNFYFQKAPGPQTVIQGGGSASGSAQPLSQDSAAASTHAVEVREAITSLPEVNFKKWDLMAGTALAKGSAGEYRGFGIVGTYNFNKYVGLSVGVIHAREPNLETSVVTQRRSDFDFSGGVTLSPVHIEIFGAHALELGVVSGFMTTSEYEYGRAYGDGSYDIKETRRVVTYIGPKMALNLGSSFGFVAEWRHHTPRYDTTHAQVGLRYRF